MRQLQLYCLKVVIVIPLLLLCCGCLSTATPPPATSSADAPTEAEPPRHQDWSDAVIYFVIVDRFADGNAGGNLAVDPAAPGAFHGGDLAGLRQHLDQIADLGVTALWLTPVVKNIDHFVTGAGFPDWAYHGYWADDFTAVDARFGSEQELAALVDACHQRGIKVLLDVVYNHVGYDSRYLDNGETRAWLRIEDACGHDDLTSCVGGLPDLKTELAEVADYLMKAHLGLAQRTGLDGFRLDTVKHVAHEFWQEHRRRTRQQLGDEFFLLGEVWGGDRTVLDPWFAGDEIDAGFDFSFAGSVFAFVQGRGRTVAFNRYLERRHQLREGYHLAHYLSSHDVPTALHQLAGDTTLFRLATVLQLTSFGIPVLYYGEEVGRRGGDWPENRSDMPWGDLPIQPGAGLERDEELRADITRLIEIRRRHLALSRGRYEAVSSEGDLLLFARQHDESGDRVLVAVNRGAVEATAGVPLPETWVGRDLYDVWNEQPLAIQGAQLQLRVAPRSALIVVAR